MKIAIFSFGPLKTRFRMEEQGTETRRISLYNFWDTDYENRDPKV